MTASHSGGWTVSDICVRCGLESGFNRVVVDWRYDQKIGELCHECETIEYGRVLFKADGHVESGCALCSGDVAVVLPLWETTDEMVEEDLKLIEGEFEVTKDTVGLCSTHFGDVDNHAEKQRTLTAPAEDYDW